MASDLDTRAPRAAWRFAARAVVSALVLAVMTYWVFLALALAGLKCDDTCSGDEASWWGYPGQFVLAALSSVLGLAALTVGFTSHKRPYRILLAYSIAGALVWAVLVFGGAF